MRTIVLGSILVGMLNACASGSRAGHNAPIYSEPGKHYSRALNTLDPNTTFNEVRALPMSPDADLEAIKSAINGALQAFQTRQLKDAETYYYRAEELGANDETILFWLGNYSIIGGDFNSASHYYEELLRINPSNAKALYNLATVYLSKAEDYFQFYTASVPDERVERELLVLLGSIDEFSSNTSRDSKSDVSPLDSLRQLLEK